LAPEATEEADIAFDSCSVLSAAACKSGRRIEIPVRITARSDRAPNLWLQNQEAWPAVRFWQFTSGATHAAAATLLISELIRKTVGGATFTGPDGKDTMAVKLHPPLIKRPQRKA
jgi:hypothetical protein